MPITVTAVGDISLGDHPVCVGVGVRSHLGGRYRDLAGYPFERIAGELRDADIVFGNLETVLSHQGLREGVLESVEMRGDPDGIQRLASAGFDVVNVANNHILQHGAPAFRETLNRLESAGILAAGVHGSAGFGALPVTREAGGHCVTILAYAFEPDRYFEGPPLYAFGPSCDIPADVRKAACDADIVICSMHWGEEFVRYPSRSMKALARAIIDAGAHAVIGHHPHVFHGIERYRHGVIAYSLGNFVFDMLWNEPLRSGLILRLTMDPKEVLDVRTAFVRIGDDYQPGLAPEAYARALQAELDQLSSALASTPSDEEYRREHARLVSINRRQSYKHFFSRSLQYPPSMWRQIVTRSLIRKFGKSSGEGRAAVV